jgi:hypothetical protein
MLTGFNNNVVYNNETYHVQTENGGDKFPVIITHIYRKGAIIASKRKSYEDILNEENSEETIRQIMENQHKNMIKALLSGKFGT